MNQSNKETLGFSNSVVWFFMDASWMMGWHTSAILFIVPTVLTGLWLVYIEKRKDIMLADLATFFWICMNCSWLLSEVLSLPSFLVVGKVSLFLGLGLLFLCFYMSEDIKKTIGEFRRFRLKQLRGFSNQNIQ